MHIFFEFLFSIYFCFHIHKVKPFCAFNNACVKAKSNLTFKYFVKIHAEKIKHMFTMFLILFTITPQYIHLYILW